MFCWHPRRASTLACALLAVLVILLLSACRPQGPQIVITPAERDLGKMPQQKLETVYTIRNTGNQILKLGRVYTSCDCTKGSVDRTEVPPGETAKLIVTMDPAQDNLYGKIRRDIIVETNDPRTPKAKAILHVEIDKP